MSKFTDYINTAKDQEKSRYLKKHAVEKPFPKLSDEDKTKLEGMLTELLELHQKKTSELTLNQKRLVEMFCIRINVDDEGNSSLKSDSRKEAFTVLKMSGYAHKFIVKALELWMPMFSMKTLVIYEDERLNYNNLFGKPYIYSGSPFHDALFSYPNYYLPVRDCKSKASIFGVYSSTKQSDLSTYKFKERDYPLKNEVPYSTPFLPELIGEKQKVEEHHPLVQAFLDAYNNQEVNEEVKTLVKEFKASTTNNFFYEKCGEDFKPSPTQIRILSNIIQSS